MNDHMIVIVIQINLEQGFVSDCQPLFSLYNLYLLGFGFF